MSYKAIDVVLLPDKKMNEFAMKANCELVTEFDSEIVLNHKDCLPHISLLMGGINDKDIKEISSILGGFTNMTPKTLIPDHIKKIQNASGKITSVIQIKRTDKLQKLHEIVCDTLKKYLTFDISIEMIAGGKVSQTTIEWIKNYPANSSYRNFSPHITIGYGDLSGRKMPRIFKVSKLAICRLVDHCTCKEILWSAGIQ